MGGAVLGAGGAEVEIGTQVGCQAATTALESIKAGVGEVAAEDVVVGRRPERQAAIRGSGVRQLVHAAALLERQVELKLSFLHCTKKDRNFVMSLSLRKRGVQVVGGLGRVVYSATLHLKALAWDPACS